MSKIKVKISETKFLSFYKILDVVFHENDSTHDFKVFMLEQPLLWLHMSVKTVSSLLPLDKLKNLLQE